jgi:hypothetical protein
MLMYYVLRCDYPKNEAGGYLEIRDGIDIDGIDSWSLGRKIQAPVPNPIEIEAVPKRNYGGPPIEMRNGNLLLMSDRLVDALREAGVDNIDVYPAVLRNTKTGQTYSYKAVNIIGIISAANLGESVWRSDDSVPLFDVSFESLVLKGGAAGEALLFRLAENSATILVHEKVREHVLAKGIDTLKFLEPKDYIHL